MTETPLGVLLVRAVDEYVQRTAESYEAVNRRAGLSRGYINKVRDAVNADPEHRIDSETLRRIAAAIGLGWTLEPKGKKS